MEVVMDRKIISSEALEELDAWQYSQRTSGPQMIGALDEMLRENHNMPIRDPALRERAAQESQNRSLVLNEG